MPIAVLLNTPLSDKVECSDLEDSIDEIDAFLAMEVSSDFKEDESIHDTSISFSPRSDPLHHEFAGELLTLPSRNVREHEEYLSLMTLLCEISTSQSTKNLTCNLYPPLRRYDLRFKKRAIFSLFRMI
ncbi:hypothetical protein Tco_0290940 [Tanacetum coccineum]